jgi:hypothetical protein
MDSTGIGSVDNNDIVLQPNGNGKLVVDSTEIGVENIKLSGNTLEASNTDGDVLLTPAAGGKVVVATGSQIRLSKFDLLDNNINVMETDADLVLAADGNGKVLLDNLVVGDLLLDGSTLSTTGTHQDMQLVSSGTGKVKMGNFKLDANVVAGTGAMTVSTGTGNLALTPVGAGKVVIGNMRMAGSTITSVGDDLLFDAPANSHIKLATSSGGKVGVGASFASGASPTATLEVDGVLKAKSYGADISTTVQTSSAALACSTSSFTSFPASLTKDVTLTQSTLVLVHYQVSHNFRFTNNDGTLGYMMTRLTYSKDGGSEVEEVDARSNVGMSAVGSAGLTQSEWSNYGTNRGMVMKELTAGTYTFEVKYKLFQCVDATCASLASGSDTVPNDPSSSSYADGRSLQIVVLGTGTFA